MVKDWAYRVAFDRKDLPSLQEMARHIRENHDTNMIERFNDNCERFLKGENPDFPVQPIDVSKTDDLVVNVGLNQCISIIQGSALRWSHLTLARNSGGTPVAVTDTGLDNSSGGPFFIPMATYGWMEAKGMKLFFGTVGQQDTSGLLGTSVVHDMGVYNGGTTGDTLLNREAFFNNPLSRSQSADLQVYNAVFIFSCVVEFCPVA